MSDETRERAEDVLREIQYLVALYVASRSDENEDVWLAADEVLNEIIETAASATGESLSGRERAATSLSSEVGAAGNGGLDASRPESADTRREKLAELTRLSEESEGGYR